MYILYQINENLHGTIQQLQRRLAPRSLCDPQESTIRLAHSSCEMRMVSNEAAQPPEVFF